MKRILQFLRRFILGEMPSLNKEHEEPFFLSLVQKNCAGLSLLAALGAVLQAFAFLSIRELPIMRDPLMGWFVLLAVMGLCVFSLFFFRQARHRMPASALWACQVVFAVYYVVVDLCVIYLNLQVQDGLLRMVPTVLLGAMMVMPGGLSAACFLAYAFLMPLMTGELVLGGYGLLASLAAYILSRSRYQWEKAGFARVMREKDLEAEKQELQKKLDRVKTWDEQLNINNRRAMHTWLEAVWPLCVRNRIPVAVLMISPDDLNDETKKASQACLKAVAETLKTFVRRKSDFLGWYGDDNFVILYSGLSRQDTDMLVHRIQEAGTVFADGTKKKVALSIGGLYALPKDQVVAAQWLIRAHELLKRAKTQGAGSLVMEEL